jgi:hypothetical protein
MQTWSRIGIVSLLLLAGACDGGISDEQRSELTTLLDAAEAHVAHAESARREGLVAFMASPTGAPAQCPAGVWLSADPLRPRDRRDNFEVIAFAELSESEGARSKAGGPHISTMRTSLDPNGMIPLRGDRFAESRQRAEQLGSAAWWPHEITFVVTQQQTPRFNGPSSFSPGFIAGKVVVWGYEHSHVVCAFNHRTDSRARQEVSHGRESSLMSGLRGSAAFEIERILTGGGS